MNIDEQLQQFPDLTPEQRRDMRHKVQLLGSLLLFTRVMFKARTGRDFIISKPVGNESHMITVCRALTDIFYLRTKNQIINLTPGWGKSEFCKHFVAWSMAHYPDCNTLYISYSHDLAAKHTSGIKEIMMLSEYQKLFGVKICSDTSAKDYFKTTSGGIVAAFGSSGSITGQDAGLPNLGRYSGAVIIDDAHKPNEVFSDTMRESIIDNYNNTIKPRPRGINVPVLFIGQCLHEGDLAAKLAGGMDGKQWSIIKIKALADNGFARYPEVHTKEFLLKEEETNEYVFHSQYQQNPQPPGGALFKEDFFVKLIEEPRILRTFLTCDTAETEDEQNDASALSFWGIYKLEVYGQETEEYALHWLDCWEFRVETMYLDEKFNQFYAKCLMHPVKPSKVFIEKKSSGRVLLQILSKQRAISVVDIMRDKNSGSKGDRYNEMQPEISKRLISLPANGEHTQMCINHMKKITRNMTHSHDDICDTVYDAVDVVLKKNLMIGDLSRIGKKHYSEIGHMTRHINHLKDKRYAATRN